MGKIKCPNGEILWVTYINNKRDAVCIITSKPSRDFYFLYEVLDDGTIKKLGKARSPTELEEKFDVKSRMN